MNYTDWLSALIAIQGVGLTVIGVVLAMLGIYGFHNIREDAKKMAAARIDEYLNGDQIRQLLEAKIAAEADKLFADISFTAAFPVSEPTGDVEPLGSDWDSREGGQDDSNADTRPNH